METAIAKAHVSGVECVTEALASGLSGGDVPHEGAGPLRECMLELGDRRQPPVPFADFKAKIGGMIDSMKSSRRQPGTSEILYPGEIEFRNRGKRLAVEILGRSSQVDRTGQASWDDPAAAPLLTAGHLQEAVAHLVAIGP